MSDPDVLALIDRAAGGAPAMHVDPPEVVEGGRRKVRRRRATGAGAAVTGLAVGGLLWAGLGGNALLGADREIEPASRTWQVDAATTVPLREAGEGEHRFPDAGTRLGEMVLRTEADGSSTVEMVVDGERRFVVGERVHDGRAVQFDGREVVVLLHPVAGQDATSQVLGGVAETVTGDVEVDGRPMRWHAAVPTVVPAAPAGGPLDAVVVEGEDQVRTLSAAAVATSASEDLDLVLWRLLGDQGGTWGVTGGDGSTVTASTPYQLLDHEQGRLWIAWPPEQATAVRLLGTGGEQMVERQDWVVDVGGRSAMGGFVPEGAGVPTRVEWQGPEGTWQQLGPVGEGAASLRTADGTSVVLRVEGDAVVAEVDGERMPTTVDPDGGPLLTLLGEGRPVFLVPGWDLAEPEDARLGSAGAGGTTDWVVPADAVVLQVQEVPVVVLSPPPDWTGAAPHSFGEETGGQVEEVATGG